MKIHTARFYQSVKMKGSERESASIEDKRTKVKYTLDLYDGLLFIRYIDGETQIVPVTNVSSMTALDESLDKTENEQECLQIDQKIMKRKRGRPPKSQESKTPKNFLSSL